MTMTLSTLEHAKTPAQHSVFPYCGRSVDWPRPAIVAERSRGTGVGTDAGASGSHCLEVVL
jgi:hypothetical protein